MNPPHADDMVDMACKLVDDLYWTYDETDDQYVVTYDKYDMSRKEDELWRALWILERDVRVEHGNCWRWETERGLWGGSSD